MKSVFRIDKASIGKVEELPGGGVRVFAQLARTGVLTYRRDGRVFREYRDPADVFAPASLASFKSAPLTVGHPPKMVTIETRKDVEVGHVEGDGRQDDTWVVADLAITDPAAVEGIRGKDLVEISCGYAVQLEGPGVSPEGVRYDAKQTGILINHVALLPKGQARAGAQAAIRLDCAIETEELPQMKTIFINGKEYRLDADDLPQTIADLNSRADKADAEKARADKAEARADAAEAKLDEAEKARPQMVAKRVALEVAARKILGDSERFDTLTDHEIRLAACSKAGRDVREDRKDSEAYVEAAFDAAVSEVSSAKRLAKNESAPADRQDSDEESQTPYQRYLAAQLVRGIEA